MKKDMTIKSMKISRNFIERNVLTLSLYDNQMDTVEMEDAVNLFLMSQK